MKQSPNPNNKTSNCYISKPVQIRLSGHRSQMEIVILPVPCCSDTCNRLGRESRKMGARRQSASKNRHCSLWGSQISAHLGGGLSGPGWTGLILHRRRVLEPLRDQKPTGRGRRVQVQCEQESRVTRAEFGWGSLQTAQGQRAVKQPPSRKAGEAAEEAARKWSCSDSSQE